MVWLKAKAEVRVQEIRLRDEAGSVQAVLQSPSGYRNRLWLALRGGEDGAECFDLIHSPGRDGTPYGDLLACAHIPSGTGSIRRLITAAESFASRWGLPLLPGGFFQMWVFWEIYCFPLDEFARMARLVNALEALRVARFANRRGVLHQVLAEIAGIRQDSFIPRGGNWSQSAVLRGGKSRIWRYETPSGPLPTVAWPPDLTVQFSPSHIPGAYLRDPYNPIRLLSYRLGRQRSPLVPQPPLRYLSEMQAYCDRIRLGVKAYVASQSQQPSLWSFVLEEWVRRYDRRNRAAYCSHVDAENRPCGVPLPLSAPANRRYCDQHRQLRERERKRETAAKRRRQSE